MIIINISAGLRLGLPDGERLFWAEVSSDLKYLLVRAMSRPQLIVCASLLLLLLLQASAVHDLSNHSATHSLLSCSSLLFHQRIYGLEAGKAQERFLVQGGKYDFAFVTPTEAMNVHTDAFGLTCVSWCACVRVACACASTAGAQVRLSGCTGRSRVICSSCRLVESSSTRSPIATRYH